MDVLAEHVGGVDVGEERLASRHAPVALAATVPPSGSRGRGADDSLGDEDRDLAAGDVLARAVFRRRAAGRDPSMKERLDLLVERIGAGHVREAVADVNRPARARGQQSPSESPESSRPSGSPGAPSERNEHLVAIGALLRDARAGSARTHRAERFVGSRDVSDDVVCLNRAGQ